LQQLTNLQTLILFDTVLAPEVLSELTQITRLSLYAVGVTTHQADDLSDTDSAGRSCTQRALLLRQLAQLQQLLQLEMFSTPSCRRSSNWLGTDTVSHVAETESQSEFQSASNAANAGTPVKSQLWPRAPEACTALLASSRLVHLQVVQCRLPAAAWQHALAVTHTFPHLTSLQVEETATNGAC
jgi:hypothetical protein